MQTATHSPLAPYTSLKVGGQAETLLICETYEEVVKALQNAKDTEAHLLGFGSNCLISDHGLEGTTIIWRGGEIQQQDNVLIADAGVWWDDVVQYAIAHNLWGLELMSEIPSSVGGAVFGNIAAYGQQVSDTLAWVEVYDRNTGEVKRREKTDMTFAYRESSLQSEPHIAILRVAFNLSPTPLHTLRYGSALTIAQELGYSTTTLEGLRDTIIETRRRAGSIYHPDDPHAERSAGSFFKNPLVSARQAEALAAYDESGKTLERIAEQNRIHGGSDQRASAAHVLLAAGFTRGQTWDRVRLHPKHVLKIETLAGATAEEVYTVTQEIITTVQDKLDITLIPEVRFLGKF
jgi:UDP-N-acetylmuramate dehydrogenase